MVNTVLENATPTDEVLFTDSTFLSEYFSMVNLLMTIYFGHTDTKWTVYVWEQSTSNRCCQECRSRIYDKCVNHIHIQIGILFIFTFISSLRGHMLCQQNIKFALTYQYMLGIRCNSCGLLKSQNNFLTFVIHQTFDIKQYW